ncbi:MAG: pyridoxamine 5-phosphate oxidase-related, FMN-binding [Clostridiaceae bacterium]|jgi:nitroimidazol reductase NimA-like FMN-containing flavoprotein (pyridoxamine 5'-phosphate oxidase superfamily)|nr:pyridoxamine 5-phosphate oxidase-related, FMN-binding [Clostridiaceae bacterium]
MRKMRRDEKSMEKENYLKILLNGEYGILCTVDSEMQPYGVPVNYVYINNRLYIHCAKEGHKLENIINNPKICFTVVGSTKVLPSKFSSNFESVVVFGKAQIALDDEKEIVLINLIKKYSPEFYEQGVEYIKRAKDKTTVISIEIEGISGKKNNR